MLAGIGYEGVQILRQQRRQYRRFCHEVEAAAAPGEPVLVRNWIAAMALRSMGSPALKEQLVYVRGDGLPASLRSYRETILVAAPNDSLFRALRSHGYSVTQAKWEQGMRRTPAGSMRNLQIFFAVAPDARKR